MLNGLRSASRSLSAITVTSSSRLMPGSRIVKTSPVARAMVSPWRSVLSSASATERSRSSPWLLPSLSLTRLKPSSPSWTTASLCLWRWAWTIATVRRSPKRRALARPVSVSWSASAWISRSSRAVFARSVASASWASRKPSRSSRTSSSSWTSREA